MPTTRRRFLATSIGLALTANRVSAQTATPDSAPKQIETAINPNIELLGFVYFLGYEGAQSETDGYSDKTRKRYAYGIDLYHRYKAYTKSRNLAAAIAFADNIWLDYFISLLIIFQMQDSTMG